MFEITVENSPKGWRWSCSGHVDEETGEPVECVSMAPHRNDSPEGATKLAQAHIVWHDQRGELAVLTKVRSR